MIIGNENQFGVFCLKRLEFTNTYTCVQFYDQYELCKFPKKECIQINI